MHAVIRRYSGASTLMEELDRKRDEVTAIISGVPGFVAYHAMRAGGDLITVTICQDQAGAAESTRRASGWVRKNLPALSLEPPEVVSGEVFLDVRG